MSDSPQPPDQAPITQREPLPSPRVFSEQPVITSTPNRGFVDIIPTLIPALQSSSYVLVILAAFLAWSSRKLVTDFLDRHIELMQTVKDSLEAERINNDKQLAVLDHLTQSNLSLTSTLQALASGANRRSEYAERTYEPRVPKASDAQEQPPGPSETQKE